MSKNYAPQKFSYRLLAALALIIVHSLLPANEVGGKVIFSEACVSHSVHKRRRCAWQGVCMVGGIRGRGTYMARGMCGRGCVAWGVWHGVCGMGCVAWGVHGAWYAWWGHAWWGCFAGGCACRTDSHCGRYASYWNVFLIFWAAIADLSSTLYYAHAQASKGV